MPRKGRDKDGHGPSPQQQKKKKKPAAGAGPMPQVWLPDLPNPEGHMDDLDGSFPPLPPPNEGGPPPTDEEERQMALFWAKEETQAPRGWDEEQELDYSEAVRKKEEREKERRDKAETPDLFKYAQSSTYCVRMLGHIGKVAAHTASESQTSTLETVDRAQKQGRLPWVTSESDQRVFSISKYGIKVTDSKKQRVYTRHSLHHIVNITYYEDTYGKHMLAVRVVAGGQREGETQQELYVYQCEDEAQAKDVCLTLAQAFEAVYNKLQLEQNLSADLR